MFKSYKEETNDWKYAQTLLVIRKNQLKLEWDITTYVPAWLKLERMALPITTNDMEQQRLNIPYRRINEYKYLERTFCSLLIWIDMQYKDLTIYSYIYY